MLIGRMQHLPIRTKLLIGYSLLFVLTIALGSAVMYGLLRSTMEENIERELTNSTAAILNMVRTAASVSIKNHLRAVAEKNLELVQHFHRLTQRRILSDIQAQEQAAALLLTQHIGTTGYIACVSSQGVMLVHPQPTWVGTDITAHAFVGEMTRRKEGYLEYDWKNPGDDQARPKALYMTYFAPWDWIINVSSYRREFTQLVNVDDFRESVSAMRFGRSGYAFVADRRGNLVIHPTLQGSNLLERDVMPAEVFAAMLAQGSGKHEYHWRDPGQGQGRKKLMIFTYLPEYEWIVACSIYLDEYYSPLKTLAKAIGLTMLASLAVLLPLTFWISASITNPLGALIRRLTGDGCEALPPAATRDEVEVLTRYFDAFMARLDATRRSLTSEIEERRDAEAALRVSEERYRSVMEAAPDPIVVYDMHGRVIYLNRAFGDVFGWSLPECIGRKLDHFVPPENWEETRQGLETIGAGRPLPAVETRRFTKSGRLIDVSVRGAVYRHPGGELAGSVIIHRDVTEIKRLQREIMEIGEQERHKIAQDLHDDLCPHLIGIEGLCLVLQSRLAEAQPQARRLIETVTQLIKEAITKTRHLARGLCPVRLEQQGLESALRDLAEKMQTLFGLACTFQCDAPVLIADNSVATHLFYIAQEAVHNAARHSGARTIEIALRAADENLSLRVHDDGCGLRPGPHRPGMGLRIMEFRAKMINAGLEIASPPGGGTTVTVTLAAMRPDPPP
jgi:PAS domain S-box-containing protein